MKPISLKPAALALALGGGLGMALAGLAIAQSKPTAAQQQELHAARADVERAAKHLAELSSEYGGTGASIRVERQVLRKPVIGVLLAPDDKAGVRIAAITPDSAAANAGLKTGDRIVSIDGKSINATSGTARVDQSRALLAAIDAKTPVKLVYLRGDRNQTVVLTPKIADRLLFLPGAEGDAGFDDDDVRVFDLGNGQVKVIANRVSGDATFSDKRMEFSGAIAPDVRREMIRLDGDCKGEDCMLPVLAEAFRWNGLNLASVDDELGRYFGTNHGVLVLSTGKDLDGLQAGDVIQKIDGKAVNSPREAMEMLRAQPAAAKVRVDYMRDRRSSTAQVTVPKALPFRIPPQPPAPPAPPAPPTPPMPPMAPAAPGAPDAVVTRKMVFVDQTGKVTQWEGAAGDTPPAWVAKLAPEAGHGKQSRKIIIIDKDGRRSEWIDDGAAPLPPPPAPKAPPPPPPPPAPPRGN